MAGLARIAKRHGGIIARSSEREIHYKWDDKLDKAVVESIVELKPAKSKKAASKNERKPS